MLDQEPDTSLVERALGAYFSRRSATDENLPQPSPDCCTAETVNGKRYVVIRSSNDILRVYRVRNDGQLKRLVNVPDGIEVAKQVAAGDSLLASNGNETPAVLPDDDDDDDDERQVFTIKDPATKQGQQRIGVLRRKADALSVHLGNTAEMLRVLDLEAIKTHAPEMVGWIQRAAAKLRRDLRHLDGF